MILFLLGLVVNGFPLFHLGTLRIYGVLQRIAICFFIASLLYLWNSRAWVAATHRGGGVVGLLDPDALGSHSRVSAFPPTACPCSIPTRIGWRIWTASSFPAASTKGFAIPKVC